MNNAELKEALIKTFEQSYLINDPAHRIDHFERVEECGIYINKTLELGYNENLITAVAYIHDAFSWCRSNHEQMSAHWVLTTKDPIMDIFTKLEKMLISDACREHRASFKGNYSTPFSELMASADRMIPKEADDLLERSILYTQAKGHDPETAKILAKEHVKEKFGHGGYARYPEMYERVFEKELKSIRDEIASW